MKKVKEMIKAANARSADSITIAFSLLAENYKILMKDIEEDTKNGKMFHAHGLEEQ